MATERTITIPASAERTATQSLLRISINIGFGVEIVLNTDGKVSTRTFSGAEYDELLAESPEWAPDKPGGVFRPQDIFAFMDHLEAK